MASTPTLEALGQSDLAQGRPGEWNSAHQGCWLGLASGREAQGTNKNCSSVFGISPTGFHSGFLGLELTFWS